MVLNLLVRSVLQSTTHRVNLFSRTAAIPKPIATSDICNDHMCQPESGGGLINFIQSRGAARRGKRIQRALQARKNAAIRRQQEKLKPKPVKKRFGQVKVDKSQFRFNTIRELDTTLPDVPEDNVFFVKSFRPKRFSLEEILEFHRQAVHPDIYNEPDTLVVATIELNLKMKIKKKKFIEKIDSTLCYPHQFKYSVKPRKIVALCPSEEDQEAARGAGAIIAGGMEVVQQLKTGQLTERDFDHLICKSSFLPDFAAVKHMKTASYFPSRARGNYGEDMAELVKYFKNGIDYSLTKQPEEPEFGFIECYFGRLDMTNDELKENLIELFNSINRFKPTNLADNKQFFQRVSITIPPTEEVFLLKFWDLIDDYKDPDASDEDDTVERESNVASA